MKNLTKIVLLALMAACILLIWYANHLKKQSSIQTEQLKAVTDVVTTYKTKDGKNAAYIRILEGDKKTVLELVKNQDIRIQQLIKETKGLKTYTNHVVVTKIDTTVITDTLRLPENGKPLYAKTYITNDHYSALVELKSDSTHIQLKTYNEFDYLIRDKPADGIFGFLRPPTYIVEAINLNPYTETKNLKTIQINPKGKTGLKIGIGIAAGVAVAILLK